MNDALSDGIQDQLGRARYAEFFEDVRAVCAHLTALEQWVEQGTAPSGQVTTDTAGVPGRTRPLCDYPKWVKYSGAGDVNLAASFTCVD